MSVVAPGALGAAIKDGTVTTEYVQEIARIVYPDDPEEQARQVAAIVQEDGSLHPMRLRFLNRSAWTAEKTTAVAAVMGGESPPAPEPPALPQWMLDDIPELPDDDDGLRKRNLDFKEEVKRKVPILTAVRLWGKPQTIKIRGVDGNMIRCPFPDHEDKHPSASANTEKNTWICHACDRGGDAIDYYMARRGFNPEAMRGRSEWGPILEEMGEAVGVRKVDPKGDGVYEAEHFAVDLPSGDPDGDDEPDEDEPSPLGPLGAAVKAVAAGAKEIVEALTPIFPPIDDDEAETLAALEVDLEDWIETTDLDSMPRIDWREALDLDSRTFLHQWMTQNEEEFPWIPPEYFLFLGIQALGMAAGHHVYGENGAITTGSLMVLLIGPSGWGKSTALQEVLELYRAANPFHTDTGDGFKLISGLSSGEAVTMMTKTEIEDPSDAVTMREVPATVLHYEHEFSLLMARAGRSSSSLKPRIIAAFDFKKRKAEPEASVEDMGVGRGHTTVHDLFFSACYLTQNDAMRTILHRSDTVTGFLSRQIPVTGPPRERRTWKPRGEARPEPMYVGTYKKLVRKWESKWLHEIPCTDDAFDFMNTSPLFEKLGEKADSMFSRLQLFACKIAFLLAINDETTHITLDHITRATQLTRNYLTRTLSDTKSDVAATELADVEKALVDFVKKHRTVHGEWPNKHKWAGHRKYREADPDERDRAMRHVVDVGLLVVVKVSTSKGRSLQRLALAEYLTDTPNPKGMWSEIELEEKTRFPGE